MSERAADQKFEDLMHGFDRMRRKKEERKAALADLEAMTVVGAAPDGSVAVTVTADGVLTGLRLGEQIGGLRPAELAALVLDTYLAAQRDAAVRATELAVTALGQDGYVHRRLQWRRELAPRPVPVPRSVPDLDDDVTDDATTLFRNL